MKTKRGILGLFLALCVVWSMLPLGAFAADAGDEPKPISTAEDLQAINANLDGHYVLDGDIDLTDYLDGGSWTPIGTKEKPFTGTFDGQGHSITGLSIKNADSDNQGLFGYMDGTNSAVRNLTVSGTVRGNGFVGGVVGYNSKGTVTNCSNTGTVSGNTYAGGVVGVSRGGTVENCYNTGTVSSENRNADIGGVVGAVSDGYPNYTPIGIVKNCYNAGIVNGYARNVGGVVGSIIDAGGFVENCYNTGSVSSESQENHWVGGVVGLDKGSDENKNCVKSCYYLEGTADIGIGDKGLGTIQPDSFTAEEFANKNSFPGWDFNSTWEMSELLGRPILRSNREGGSGTPASPYEIPDLATLEYYRNKINADTEGTTYRGASYVLTDDIDMSEKYGEGEDKDSWEPIGTYDTPFTGTFDGGGHSITGLYIYEPAPGYQGLFGYMCGTNSAVRNLTVSGTVSGSLLSSVGGVVGYNNGGTIENCTFEGSVSNSDRGNAVGGVVGENSGTVKNCTFKDGNVSVSGSPLSYVGGVVGENSGTVKNCSNTGMVSVSGIGMGGSAGGVVGQNANGIVESCYNTGTVTGTGTSAGGVVGENSGTVENCYNTGKVNGGDYVGGVVGGNYDTVTDCYNTGKVTGSGISVGGVVGKSSYGGTVANCYNTGSVSGSSLIGGVVGQNDSGTVANCYNTGTVIGEDYVGGVVGYNSSDGTITNCYYEESKAGSGIGSSESNENAESKDVGAFKSGEVAWLLQDGQDSNIWGQTLTGETPDRYPVLKVFDADAPRVYRVTFAGAEDVSNVSDQYVNENCTVTKPDIPGKEDSTLGWYSDSEYTKRWDFENDTVRQDMTLHAKWLSKDAGVSSVTVSGTKAEPGENNTFTVTLPAGSSLPANANEITIIPVTGATVSEPTSTNGGATWTFTVTAEDGTKADYTIQITVEQPEPEPDPEPETPVTPPAPPSGGGPSNPTYRPDIGTTENGEVDVSTTRPHAGDTVTVTPKPDDGYDVQTVTVTDEDGETVPVTKNEDGSFTFTQPAGEVTIDVAFTPHVSSSIEIQNGASVAIASPDDVIEIPQSSTFTVHFTSEKPLSDFAFLAGNGKAIATDTVSVWNPETREGTYTLYGLGAPGSAHDTTGIYVNGVKLFTMKVVPRPLTSDTTVDFAMSVGQTYQFWVKPDDPDANYTFNTANGEMLQTAIVKDAYPDEQGRYLCRLTVTGRGDTVGVYCSIDGNTYKLFTVDCR